MLKQSIKIQLREEKIPLKDCKRCNNFFIITSSAQKYCWDCKTILKSSKKKTKTSILEMCRLFRKLKKDIRGLEEELKKSFPDIVWKDLLDEADRVGFFNNKKKKYD
jgi:hypothetical protein